MKRSSIAIVTVLALALGFTFSWLMSSKPVELEAGRWFGEQARALPEFELSDHRGEPVNRDSLRGKWSLMFFGFTHCPDICPTSVQAMSDMIKAIDDPQVLDDIAVYFISVDPQRDTAEVLASYVNYFNPAIIAATAELDKLRMLTGSLGIAHFIRNQVENSDRYDVDHSSTIVLINPAAEYAGIFSAPHDPMVMARDMTRIVEYN